ncbi:MAG TPA: alpha/beta hydrolase [Nitrososphaeraceae archaeon]|nr:alpha/beta hydrolase [Nitrososphaeraceae archaeon]
MSNQESISKHWFFVIPLSFLIIVFGFLIINIIPSNTVLLISSNNYLGTSNFAYGQQQEEQLEKQINSNITKNSINVQNILTKKVHVGDIEIAYKTFGKGEPIILINGYSFAMDSWHPTLLEKLTANHTVIIFDNRGIGNTSSGADEQKFSIGQFANDTAGLLEALKIKKVDVLGWSMGGAIAQELAISHPDRVGKLIIHASFCGPMKSIQPSQEVLNAMTNETGTAEDRISRLHPLFFPEEWRKENPNYLDTIPKSTEIISNQTLSQHKQAIANWTGTCNKLSNITQPTLVIVGTKDTGAPPVISLQITEQIPGAWLVQIKGGGHALMYQYPEQFSNIVEAFLENANTL